MRTSNFAAALLAGTLAAACVSSWTIVQSGVVLGPGGRATGTLALPAGEQVVLRLRNQGPGRADFSVKDSTGRVMQEGALDQATVDVTSSEAEPLHIDIRAGDDAGTAIAYSIAAKSGLRVVWDLSQANR